MTAVSSRVLVCLLTSLLWPAAHAAPSLPPAGIESRITVSGTGEAAAPAARGTLSIGIQTHGTTAAAAGTDGARLSNAVTTALRSAGLSPTDLKSTHLAINPQWGYDEQTHQQRRTGFQADTTLIITTTTLDRLGAWVDAALDAGATTVSDPAFAPADEDALRHLALSRAVQNARGDAQIIAIAAGGSLGPLLQINQGQPMVMPMGVSEVTVTGSRRAALAPATNLVPDEIHVTATVSGTWRYIAAPGTAGR